MPKANCTTVCWRDEDGMYTRYFATRQEANVFVSKKLRKQPGIYRIIVENRHDVAPDDPRIWLGLGGNR